jgi:hypothetical protein
MKWDGEAWAGVIWRALVSAVMYRRVPLEWGEFLE